MKRSPIFLLLALCALFVTSCKDDEVPPEENEQETITNVTLTFTPDGGGTAVKATWVDADGNGAGKPVLSDITLAANTTYTMDISITNLIDPQNPENTTDEIDKEKNDHMFFFGWTNGLFTSPTGDGNIGKGFRDDPINYGDSVDDKGLPLGLETTWTTGAAATGTFQVILKHQPDGIKSATSDTTSGESDVDVTWNMTVQ